MRRQNTAVAGTVEQGKTSFLAATVAEDLLREHCAVIVLDPKGDAAEVAVGMVPTDRTCTVLDFANPTCGFNPLAVDAPADVIADYVVAALKNLFSDAGAIFRP
jgi:Ni2+-binding GTPase involved in maturation of urease and hydrogenase